MVRGKIYRGFVGRATKSTPAFLGSQTAANCRVFWLSGLLTADVGPFNCKLSDCLVVRPVDGRCRARRRQIFWLSGCRACRRQMSGPSTANCLVVWMLGLTTANLLVVWLSGLLTADVGLSSQLNWPELTLPILTWIKLPWPNLAYPDLTWTILT
jgi:hypothetical protein